MRTFCQNYYYCNQKINHKLPGSNAARPCGSNSPAPPRLARGARCRRRHRQAETKKEENCATSASLPLPLFLLEALNWCTNTSTCTKYIRCISKKAPLALSTKHTGSIMFRRKLVHRWLSIYYCAVMHNNIG